MSTLKQQKQQLRRQLRKKRRQLSKVKQYKASLGLQRYLLNAGVFLRARHIAIYIANDGELDLSFLLSHPKCVNKCFYLPVVAFSADKHLSFVRYHKNMPLKRNRYFILEPKNRQAVNINRLELVLLPLVGFDQQGHRLGMGGGFYDTTFAQHGANTLLLGVAHHIQQVTSLPVQSWDIPISHIISNQGIIAASQ